MRRLLNLTISLNSFALFSLLALLLLLVPMLNAARYDVPSADDYPYGIRTYQVWSQTADIGAVLKTSMDHVKDIYYGWQGSFSAIFLFTLNPMIFGEQYYQIGPWLIIGMLLSGIFSLIFTLFGQFFKASRSECLIIAVVWSVICIQFLPRASQGLYWFNGAVYYSFFFGLACLTYSILISFICRSEKEPLHGKILKLIISSVLLFLIGGGNLVTGLTTAVLLVTMEAVLFLMKRNEWKTLLIPFFLFFIGFLINVSAPGNAVRQEYFAQPGLFKAVILSFQQIWKFGRQWFSLPVAALILLLIPILCHVAVRSEVKYRMPWLLSIYSICLSGVMFYAPIYSMTDHNLDHLGRIINIIFFGMTFLAIFNLYYWIGWLIQRKPVGDKSFPAAGNARFPLVYFLIILLLFSFGMTRIKWYDTTSISAFRSYRSGQMGNYFHTYKLRLNILKDPEIKDAVLKRFPSRPYVLYYQELSEDPKDNVHVAMWYGKNSVIIR